MAMFERTNKEMNFWKDTQCPKCGQKMLRGYIIGWVKHYLHWYTKENRPSEWELFRVGPPFCRQGSPETGMLLHPIVDGICRLPARNCPNCKLVLVDYNEEHIQL